MEEFGDYIKQETLSISIEKDIQTPDTECEFEGIIIKVKR